MPRFAANLSILYTEYPALDRFAAAVRDGFDGVELLFPYELARKEVELALRDSGLTLTLINTPPGNWDAGERGLACLPRREAEFRLLFQRAMDYARALDCARVHVMAGVLPREVTHDVARETFVENLRWAAGEAAVMGREILIEPLNATDSPGYFLSRQEEAHRIVTEVGSTNLRVQMDLYHCGMTEGDPVGAVRQYLGAGVEKRVGHLQIAGMPGRHEPDTGVVNFEEIFELIDELGFEGWVGCEYFPAGGTSDGLEWLRRWNRRKETGSNGVQ